MKLKTQVRGISKSDTKYRDKGSKNIKQYRRKDNLSSSQRSP
jgi:hypothetical protein